MHGKQFIGSSSWCGYCSLLSQWKEIWFGFACTSLLFAIPSVFSRLTCSSEALVSLVMLFWRVCLCTSLLSFSPLTQPWTVIFVPLFLEKSTTPPHNLYSSQLSYIQAHCTRLLPVVCPLVVRRPPPTTCRRTAPSCRPPVDAVEERYEEFM